MRAFWTPWMGLVVAAVLAMGCGDASVAGDPGEACEVDGDCVQGASCQTGTCDLSKMECTYTINANYCLVAGSCYVGGSVQDDDKCKACNPSENATQLTAVQCGAGQICDSSQGCVAENLACNGDDAICVSENPCVTGACGDNGFCEYNNVAGGSCDDGDACTDNDICDDAGACAGDYTCACAADSDCPQGNACQTGQCNADNACWLTAEADATGCDDGDACTENDECTAGACGGTAMSCADADACNVGLCADGTCTTQPAAEGTVCDDANGCTKQDDCDAAGVCQGEWDSSACSCQNDGDCAGTAPTCKEAVCNGGQCESVDAANGTSCDDGDPCTSGNTCQSGSCGGGTAVTCDDTGNPCTYKTCETAGGGCVTQNATTQTTCNDGMYCTTNDHCDGSGACVGGGDTLCPNDNDQNECTVKTCDEAQDACVDTGVGEGTSCTPSNVCVEDASCQGGVCVDGAAVTCLNADNNKCTDESCVAAGNAGCQVSGNVANGTTCGKGGATCNNGVCESPECTKDSQCNTNPCKVFECQNNECVQTASGTGPCGEKKACMGEVCTDVDCTVDDDCPQFECTIYECQTSYACQGMQSKIDGATCKNGFMFGTCQQGQCDTGKKPPGSKQ